MPVRTHSSWLAVVIVAVSMLAALDAARAETTAAAPSQASSATDTDTDAALLRNPAIELREAVAAIERIAARLADVEAAATARSATAATTEAATDATHTRQRNGLAALRSAVGDARRPVALLAGETLSLRSDAAGLAAIADAAQRGLISDIEAVELFSLAERDIAAKYLGFHLNSGSLSARRRAAELLARVPSAQPSLQRRALVANDWPLPVRTSAIRALMIEAPPSRGMAADIMAAPTTPFAICAAILDGLAAVGSDATRSDHRLAAAVTNCRARGTTADARLLRAYDRLADRFKAPSERAR